ncbi:hypothetical protein BVC80_8791g11 [Macleaya cordata]|uniref:RNase H type-1 domain-containing protein n=1 Tax=Macleaya cordata TaxID=56857 RepID=A0A200QIP4_MACCD|nr:hypothetical protein BVC80_8791g11 [Macleaya cordata]
MIPRNQPIYPCFRTPPLNQNNPCDYWKPPHPGWTKINADGAWDLCTNKGGMGFIFRDHNHNVLFAAALHSNIFSAEEAEVRAIWAGVHKALEMNIKKVMIECDAEMVINKLKGGDFDGNWCTDALLKDLKEWLPKFESFTFTYIPRVCNIAAHELAQWGKTSMLDMFWSIPPLWLLPFIGKSPFIS